MQDGTYEFDGLRQQLALTDPGKRNAIHGLVRWSRWSVAEREPHRVVMENILHPQPGYPFSLDLRVEYALSRAGITVRATATNIGRDACPYGSGAHPYLTVGTPTVDSVTLSAPGRTVILSDERAIPKESVPVAGAEYDFREPRPIGQTKLDNAFTDLERDAEGRARVELRDESSGVGVALWMDEAYGHVMLFTGDPLPDVNRRALAVEPMTCPPHAFRTGEAVVRLEPGRSFTSSWGISLLGG